MAEQKMNPIRLDAMRPLSPHLQIYRPMLTMMMSIAHRITGAALYAGAWLLAWPFGQMMVEFAGAALIQRTAAHGNAGGMDRFRVP